MPATPKSISIDGDNNIVIQDAKTGNITINTTDREQILKQLKRLNLAQIDTLLHMAESQKEQIGDLFEKLLVEFARQPGLSRLPKELTLSIRKIHPEDVLGREGDLADLNSLLTHDKRIVVVNGLGGIGKTTLAQAYVSKYYDEYAHIAWVTQSSRSIAIDFLNTPGLIESLMIKAGASEPEKMFEEIVRKLKSIEDKPNLLIIDNAEASIYTARDLLPSQPLWHVLLTSREELTGFYCKPLGFLTRKYAIKLFKKHYTHHRLSAQDIKDLVEVVDYHTLTIEVLAKTAQVQRYNAETLKEAINHDVRAHIEVSRESGQVEKVGAYLSAVFNLSHLNETELWLMKQLACLPSEFHSYDLLKELITGEGSQYKEFFSETLTTVARKGWLLQDNKSERFKMHRIIGEVVRKQLTISADEIKTLTKVISRKLNLDYAKDNPVDKFPWIPFGKTLLNHFREDTTAEIILLQSNLALVLKDQGDYSAAKVLLQKSALASEEILGTDHPFTARNYSDLALVLQDLGDYEEARALLAKAVLSNERNVGADDPSTAKMYANLGLVLKDLGEYEASKAILEKAMQSDESNFGPDHPSTAKSRSNLALVLVDLGEYDAAKALLEKVLLTDERNFGPNHPSTARSYSNLALVLKSLGRYEDAKVLLQKSLLSDEKNFGPDHPSTAISYSNLATALKDLGEYAGAKVLLQKALLSDERNFGPDHPSTAISYSNMALVLRKLGEYEQAKALLQKALLSDEKNFGPDHPSTARSYSNLALVLQDLGDYESARSLLQKAVLSDEKNFGTDHPSTAIRYSNLALVLQNLGDYESAKALLQKAFLSDQKKFGPDHPSTVRSYSNLALVLQDLGDYEEAKALLNKALFSAEKNFGPDHPSTAVCYCNLALLLQDLGESEKACELSAKALAILKNALPEGHPHITTVLGIYQSIIPR